MMRDAQENMATSRPDAGQARLALALCLALLGAGWLARGLLFPADPRVPRIAEQAPESGEPATNRGAGELDDAALIPLDRVEDDRGEDEAAVESGRRKLLAEGRVVDMSGKPLGGVGVGIIGDQGASASSDETGRFVVHINSKSRTMVIIDPQWAGLRSTPIRFDGRMHQKSSKNQ